MACTICRRLGIAALLLLAPSLARGFCPTAPPPLLALETQVSVDPVAALAAGRRALAAPAGPSRRAWLQSIVAAAYGALELGDDERAAADAGLALPLAPGDPARLALLMERALSLARIADIEPAIAAIDHARRLQPPGSAANICAMNAIGLLDHVTGHPERATPMLLGAYRAANTRGLVAQRAAIASNFAAVLMRSGDLDGALTLNAEELAFTRARGLTYAVANAQYFRGQILGERGDWAAALAAYGTERTLAARLHDEQGVAFAEIGTCEAAVELHRPTDAATACRAAARRLAAGKDQARKKVGWLQARIALARHDPAAAVALLGPVLDRENVASASPVVTAAFATRAAAEAALGRYRAAYADLDRAAARRAAAARLAVDRQLATMRARFALDAQAQRTAALEHDFRRAAERSSQQRALTGLALVATVAVVALLATIIVADRRHRRILTRLASADALTGLPNRRRISDVATAALEAWRPPSSAAIALIDLDHFKAINDRFGHAAGDAVLRAFTARARSVLRDPATLGRWGGEEFLLVVPDGDAAAAGTAVERLRAATAALRFDFAPDLRLTFSAGVAVADAASTLSDLVARADDALYRAKRGGRDRIELADSAPRPRPLAVAGSRA